MERDVTESDPLGSFTKPDPWGEREQKDGGLVLDHKGDTGTHRTLHWRTNLKQFISLETKVLPERKHETPV